MKHTYVVLFLPLLFLLLNYSIAKPITTTKYNVVNLGAKPDGQTDSTKSFLSAWDVACGSFTPAIIYVPRGRYVIQSAHFGGQCNNKAISIRIEGTLVAPLEVIGNSGNWLSFEGVNGVRIRGGVLDGGGTSLWACKLAAKSCPVGATVCFILTIVYMYLIYT